ncbi:GNAT family N-acetyltransferase [Minwuia sp.]|uniref:GNAT family N-acetyltransferase n=1 Tax=Minwuia sp. TaxID=2493630 RepID=UPI003A90F9BD
MTTSGTDRRSEQALIRPFEARDATPVRDLFIRVNRGLAPPHMRGAFELYIQRSLTEEIDRIGDYFADRNGAFFVAERGDRICGMFGLETVGPGSVELRRMYVDPDARGLGLGRQLLARAEAEARKLGGDRLILSTSEVQEAALGLYRSSGYVQTREEIADTVSNKTLGGGLRRFHFEKPL